ncbi:uncharacterized protein lrrc53 [Halichoeres trimaculatus]|uniref:uncharacterized protein lrrc53 n=1 Tax=Halichoeres trimaculatus TaxID=147232 RepID=UPI003D9E6146
MTSVLLMFLLSVIRALIASPVPSCPASCVVCSDEAIICHRLAHIIVAPETTQALLLTEGSISTVQFVSLSDFSNITIIGLSNNHISVLGDRSFRKLPVLHTLLLDHNLLTSQALQEGALTDLAQLKVLALGHNLISMIEGSWFTGSKALRSLKLEGNLLTSIQTRSFPVKDLADLESLDLSDNLIHHLESNSFDGLVNLHTLDLSRNRLSSAPVEAFSYLSWLTNLNLDLNSWNCSCQLLEMAAFLASFMQQPDKTLYNGRRMVCVSADNPAVTTVLELTEANCVPSNQNITVYIETRGAVTPQLYARDLAITAVICFIGGVGLTLLGVLIYSQVQWRRKARAAKKQKEEEEGRSAVRIHCVNHIDVHKKRRDKLWEREDMVFDTRGDGHLKSRDEDHSGPFRCPDCNGKDQRGADLMRWRNDGEVEPCEDREKTRMRGMKEEERLFGNQQGVFRRDRAFSHSNTNSSSHPRKETLSHRAETEAGRSWRLNESLLCESCHRTYRGAEQRPGRSHGNTRESAPFTGLSSQHRHTDRSRNLNHNPSDITKNPDSGRETRNVTFDLRRGSQVKQEEGEERGRRHKAKVQSSKTLRVKLNLNPLRKSKVHPKRKSELNIEKSCSKKTTEKRDEDEDRQERKKKKSSKAKGSVEEEEDEEERGKTKTLSKQKKDPFKKGEGNNKDTETEHSEEQPASSSSAAQGPSSQGGGVQYQGAGLVQQPFSLSAASRNQTTNLPLLSSQLTGSSLSLQGGHLLFPSGPGMTPGGAPDSLTRPMGASVVSPAVSLQAHSVHTFPPQTPQPAALAPSFGANPAVTPAQMQAFMQPRVNSALVAGLKPDPGPQISEAHPLPPESQASQSTTPQTQVPPGVGGPPGLNLQPPGPGTTVEDLSNNQGQTVSVQIPAGLSGEGLSVNEGLAAGPSGDVAVPGVSAPTVSTQSVSSTGDTLLQQEYLSEEGGSSPRRKLRLVLPEKTSGRPPTALERKIR